MADNDGVSLTNTEHPLHPDELEQAARALCKHLDINPDGTTPDNIPFWRVWTSTAEVAIRASMAWKYEWIEKHGL